MIVGCAACILCKCFDIIVLIASVVFLDFVKKMQNNHGLQ